MKKRTKALRIFALFASLVVALVGFAAPARAAEDNVAKIGGMEYGTLAEAVDAAKNGDTITLIANVEVESTVIVRGKALTLNLNGKTITNTKDLWSEKPGKESWSIISVRGGASLVVNGEGAIDPKENDCYAFDVQSGSSLTINGGRHVGNLSVVYLYGKSSLTVNGGEYSLKQLSQFNDCRFLVNCLDASYKDGSAQVAINGGTFHGFNPANNAAEGAGTMFLGYGAVSSSTEESKNDAVYTVTQLPRVAETGGKQYVSLADAIANVADGGTITMLSDVKDAKGITVPSGKAFTVDFAKHTYTIVGPGAGSTGTETNGFQLLKGSTITFKNGTVNVVENAAAHNVARIIQNYANLTLENMRFETANLGANEDYALSFNNGDVVFKGDTTIATSSPDKIAFDVCQFSSYPACTVTFDDTYTGEIGGKIVYDAKNATTHKLTFKGDGTFAGVEVSKGSEDAAKDGIEIVKGTFKSEINEEWLAADAVLDKLPDGSFGVHKHVGEAVAEKKATCAEEGLDAHWRCVECGDLFEDGALTKITTLEKLKQPKTSCDASAAIAHKAKEPTATEAGNKAYWECATCKKLYSDAELKTETSLKDVTLSALGVPKATVTFVPGAGKDFTQTVEVGSKLERPADPKLDGWKFVGWFKAKAADGTLSDKWRFDEDAVSADMTLYGGWVRVGSVANAGATSKPVLPQTGDDSMLPIVAVGAAGALAVGVGVAVIVRRRKAE